MSYALLLLDWSKHNNAQYRKKVTVLPWKYQISVYLLTYCNIASTITAET